MQKSIVTKLLLSFTISLSMIFAFSASLFTTFTPTAFAQSTNPTQTAALQQEIDELRAAGYNAPQLPTDYSDISLATDMTPEVPGPDQAVTVNLTSYSTDLSKAVIVWSVNGKIVQNATGDTTLQFATGNIGTQTTVSIVVKDVEGNTTIKSITIAPGDIDLLWQADSYTPPFYEGKALYPDQGTVKIVAVPEFVTLSGTKVNPKDLVYTWTRDTTPLPNDSGYGKDSITISDAIPEGPTTIDVSVSTLSGSITAEKQLTIQSQDNAPQVILYQKDPVVGVEYQSALTGSFDLADTEATVVAIPYFFSTVDPIASVNYKWSLNGSVVPNQTGNSITIRNQNSGGGSASLSVAAAQAGDQFQTSDANLSVEFGAASN